MKYCPECEDEYLDEIEVCSDCGMPLVSAEAFLGWKRCEAEERDALSHEDFVSVRVAENAFEADLVRAALEQEGIPVLVRTFQDTAYDGIFVAQKGWGYVEVPESFRERAEQIVGEIRDAFPESATPDKEPEA